MSESTKLVMQVVAGLLAAAGIGGAGFVGGSDWLESQYEEVTAELATLRTAHIEYVRSSNQDLEDCRSICLANGDPRGLLFRSAPMEAMPDVSAPPPTDLGAPPPPELVE